MATAFKAVRIGPSKSGLVDYALVIESMVHVVMPLVLLVILWPVGMALVVVVIWGLVGMAVAVVVIWGLVGMVVVVVVIRRPEGMALVVVVIRGLVGMVVVVAVMAEVALVVMSVGKFELLVMDEPEVLALVKMEQLVMPEVPDQPVRYLVYAIEWWYQHILQGNSFHLQWGNLSRYPHSLILRVARLVRMHIQWGLVFPQINP